MENRLLELALETLERRKAALQLEIDSVEAELRSGRKSVAAAPAARYPRRTAAQRKAQSEKMKKYWALRKQTEGKARPATKGRRAKAAVQSAAAKAASERMKAYWAKRKAAEAKAGRAKRRPALKAKPATTGNARKQAAAKVEKPSPATTPF